MMQPRPICAFSRICARCHTRVPPEFCPLVDVGGGLHVDAGPSYMSVTVRLHVSSPGWAASRSLYVGVLALCRARLASQRLVPGRDWRGYSRPRARQATVVAAGPVVQLGVGHLHVRHRAVLCSGAGSPAGTRLQAKRSREARTSERSNSCGYSKRTRQLLWLQQLVLQARAKPLTRQTLIRLGRPSSD